MQEFKNLITEPNADACRQVSLANWICVYSSEEWRKSFPDTYFNAFKWREYHLNNPDTKDIYNECERLIYNRHQRGKRMNAFVMSAVISHDCLLLTLTFTDEVLSKTSSSTRREYVSDFFRQFDCYTYNLDFGAKSGREHYHGLLVGVYQIDAKKWRYGALNVQRVRNGHVDAAKVSKYINKISNHATKDTVKSRVVYSKIKPSQVPASSWYYERLNQGLPDLSDVPF